MAPLLPRVVSGSTDEEGIGATGGEYWVPASTVEDAGDPGSGRLCGFGVEAGDCGMCRGNAAGGGGLM